MPDKKMFDKTLKESEQEKFEQLNLKADRERQNMIENEKRKKTEREKIEREKVERDKIESERMRKEEMENERNTDRKEDTSIDKSKDGQDKEIEVEKDKERERKPVEVDEERKKTKDVKEKIQKFLEDGQTEEFQQKKGNIL